MKHIYNEDCPYPFRKLAELRRRIRELQAEVKDLKEQ